MDTNKSTARTVGILFIVGTLAGILSAVLMQPILNHADFLGKVSASQNQIVTGAILVLVMGLALSMIPVVMFPIFKKFNEPLAFGAVIFRGALEAGLYIAMIVTWLLMLTVGQEYVNASTVGNSYFQTLGTLLLKAGDQINSVLKIVFSVGALMIYYLYFRSGLIPRWLSLWGLVGALLYLTSGFFALFSIELGILLAPLGVQEMVLALWLIVKGFSPTPLTDQRQGDASGKRAGGSG